MTTHIRLLKLIVEILTIFPGILIVAQTKLPRLKRLKGNQQYSLALICVCVINCIIFHCWISLLSILFVVILTYTMEFLLNESNNLNMGKMKYEIKTLSLPFFVMIFCPIFEEYIYRYFIYQYVMNTIPVIWLYFLISILSFVFCHLMTQKLKSLYKLPLAIIECVIFVCFKDIFMCIIIHMAYNILVYSHNMQKYIKINNYF